MLTAGTSWRLPFPREQPFDLQSTQNRREVPHHQQVKIQMVTSRRTILSKKFYVLTINSNILLIRTESKPYIVIPF